MAGDAQRPAHGATGKHPSSVSSSFQKGSFLPVSDLWTARQVATLMNAHVRDMSSGTKARPLVEATALGTGFVCAGGLERTRVGTWFPEDRPSPRPSPLAECPARGKENKGYIKSW